MASGRVFRSCKRLHTLSFAGDIGVEQKVAFNKHDTFIHYKYKRGKHINTNMGGAEEFPNVRNMMSSRENSHRKSGAHIKPDVAGNVTLKFEELVQNPDALYVSYNHKKTDARLKYLRKQGSNLCRACHQRRIVSLYGLVIIRMPLIHLPLIRGV